MGELVFLCFLEAVGIAAFILAFDFPRSIIDKSGGPAFFPQAVVGFLTLFVLIRVLQIIKTPKEKRGKFHFLEMFKGESLVYLIATLLVVILMRSLGFILTMSTYLIFLILFLHRRKRGSFASVKMTLIVVLGSIAGTVLIDYVFCDVMKVMIPRGIIGF